MNLSNAERLVLEKLCAGMTPKQIATEQLIYMASSLIDPGV